MYNLKINVLFHFFQVEICFLNSTPAKKAVFELKISFVFHRT